MFPPLSTVPRKQRPDLFGSVSTTKGQGIVRVVIVLVVNILLAVFEIN